jgi:lipoprotein-anchoring transpeptidase ErfK/SrfK
MLERSKPLAALLLAVVAASACERTGAPTTSDEAAATENPGDANIFWDETRPTAEELDRGRTDPSWRRVVLFDTVTENGVSTAREEEWDEISPQRVNTGAMYLPLGEGGSGPSVLRAQILLDRAYFSPGIIDGRWGANTEKAVYWFQHREGLPATGRLDQRTFARLSQRAGTPGELIDRYTLTREDVEGPFIDIPESRYDQAELECMCYESLQEKLAERFHTSPELLGRLNPDVALGEARAGQALFVPAVRDTAAFQGPVVARIVISDEGRYLHALDGAGRLVFHFPSTLGSQYSPSPTGDFRVTSVTEEPWWHYQPALLPTVDDDEPDARIPPGPNNAVGMVWMALSKPHYGIHGTDSPETIGTAVSAGCVRLTNWDAVFLSRRLGDGTPVEFRDTGGGGA